MKLPISLLLLVTLGEAVDLTTEVSKTSTIKRELQEGVFGQRTEQLKKYVPTQSTPEYTTNNFRTTPAEHPPTQQTFGAKLPQITKISDLLTAQSPSFEQALAKHLYSPVSAYNFKLPTYEENLNIATKNFFSKTKSYKHQKHLDEPKHNLQDLPSNQDTSQTSDLFSHINSDFHVGPATPPFPFGPAFSGIDTSFAASHNPQKFTLFGAQTPYGFRLRGPSHNELLQFYDGRSQAFPPNFGFENENHEQKGKEESKELKEPQKYDLPERNELENQRPIPIEVYNSHPNGAISYASFLSDPFFNGQSETQELFKQFSKSTKQPFEAALRQQQQFYIPQLYQPEHKDASPESHKEYYPGQHEQKFEFYPAIHSDKSSAGQFISIPLSHYKELYLSANRQQLNPDLQQGAAHQLFISQGVQKAPLKYKNVPSTAESEPLGQSSTQSPSTYQTVSNYQSDNAPTRYTDEANKSETIDDSSVRIYLPTPGSTTHPLSVQPLNPRPTVSEAQIAITPKTQLTHDKAIRSTTVQPETVRNTPGSSHQLFQDSNALRSPQSTLQSVLSSPSRLQSLSIRRPEHFQSTTLQPQIFINSQKSHLPTTPQQPIHLQRLELDTDSTEPTQQIKGVTNTHPTAPTPPQYQDVSTPRPESSTIDYEIEIASNVDHSQLPKELRPVTSAQRHIQSGIKQTKQRKEQAYRQGLHLLREGKVPQAQQGKTNHLHQDISPFNPYVSPFLRPLLNPIDPLIQPRAFSGVQEVVVPAADLPQSYVPSFPSLQYFGNYAGSLFGGSEE